MKWTLSGLLWWLDPVTFDLSEAFDAINAVNPLGNEAERAKRLGVGTEIDDINYPLGTREHPLVVEAPGSPDRNFDAYDFGGYDVYRGETVFPTNPNDNLPDGGAVPNGIEGYDSHSNFVGSDMPIVWGWWDNLIRGNIPDEPNNPASAARTGGEVCSTQALLGGQFHLTIGLAGSHAVQLVELPQPGRLALSRARPLIDLRQVTLEAAALGRLRAVGHDEAHALKTKAPDAHPGLLSISASRPEWR